MHNKVFFEDTLPKWDDLPEIDVYMDQLIYLVNRYVSPFYWSKQDSKVITPSMVNNYVKLKLIPKPEKKKYNQQQIARLIVITILKQAFDISSIQQSIDFQVNETSSKHAYNSFCDALERASDTFLHGTNKNSFNKWKEDFAPIEMACMTIVAKLITEKKLLDLITIDQQTKKEDNNNE